MQRIRYLDGWRGCAIICVIFAHFVYNLGINLGRFGVELFFVLSGRLMAEILFVKKTPLATFFPRRFSRIYPALIVLCTILYLLSLAHGAQDPDLIQYVSAITFTSNYIQLFFHRSPVLDHIWSLCIEEHMYVFLAAVAFVRRRKDLPVMAVLLLVALVGVLDGAVSTMLGHGYYDVYWRTDVRGASLIIGAIAFLTFCEKVPLVLQASWIPVVFGLAAMLINIDLVPDPIKYSVGTVMLALSLVLMPQAPKFIFTLLENPIIVRFGLWSYSLYLWQQPFASLGGNLPHRLYHLLLAVIAAAVSFYLIEQPARLALNRIVQREEKYES